MDGGGALGHVFQNALSGERDVGKAVITLQILAEEDNYQWWPKSAIYTYITYVVMETTTHKKKKLLYFLNHYINFKLLHKVALYFTARVN